MRSTLIVRAKAVVEDGTIVKQTTTIHSSRAIFDCLLTLRDRTVHPRCTARFADRFMNMEKLSLWPRDCRRAYATHGGRPARHAQVTSGQLTFFEVFAKAK
jgi:hypothetical protein